MKKKLLLSLLLIPFICLIYVSRTTANRDYIKVKTSISNVPEIYSNINVSLLKDGVKQTDIKVSKYLDDIYIYGAKAGDYTLKLGYNNQAKDIKFHKEDKNVTLKSVIFDSTTFDYYKFILSFGILVIISMFIYFTSKIINKRKDIKLKIANNAFIILVGFRFLLVIFKYLNIDLEYYQRLYTISIYAEKTVGFMLLLYVIESFTFKHKKLIKNIVWILFIYSLLASTLILFGQIGNIFGYFGTPRNIFVVLPLYYFFFSSGDYVLIAIPGVLLGNQIYKFYKLKSKLYFKQELPLFLLMVLALIFQWNIASFSSHSDNGNLRNILNIYTFLFSLILVLFKAYLYSDNEEYNLVNKYFWILFKLTFYLLGAYLFLVYSKSFKLVFIGGVGVLIIDISYTIFKHSIDDQFFSLNHILYRENEASTLTQFKDLIKKGIENRIVTKEIDLEIDFDGIYGDKKSDKLEMDKTIYFKGTLEEKTIVLLSITPIYELKIFEKKALEELVNEIPKVSLKINNREESYKGHNLDSYGLTTKLLEIKELIILNNNLNNKNLKELKENPIEKTILAEIDSIIQEVDKHE